MQHVGQVRKLGTKPYAFIRKTLGSEDIFVHQNECPGRTIPPDGSIVEFRLGTYKERPVASDIVIVALPEAASVSTEAVTNVEA